MIGILAPYIRKENMSYHKEERPKELAEKFSSIKAKRNKLIKRVGLGIGGFFAFIVIINSFYTNAEYERAVMTRMGKVMGVTGPGLHFKVPFIDSAHTADTRMDKLTYKETVATKDGQIIGVTITINHRINAVSEEALVRLYTKFGPGFDYDSKLLKDAGVDRVKSTFGRYLVDVIPSKRDHIRMEAKDAVTKVASKYGIEVEDVQLSDIRFSNEYRERLDDVASKRAEALGQVQVTNKEKELARIKIIQAEANKQQKQLDADGIAYKTKVESIAKANATKREGLAKAASLRAQAKALKNSPDLIELTRAEALMNWKGQLPTTVLGGGQGGPFQFLDAGKFTSMNARK